MTDYLEEFKQQARSRGAQAARLGFPILTLAQWKWNGYDAEAHKHYARGYRETFDAMSPDEKKAAALSGR